MSDRWLVEKIVSGGQTGVDRAALDWAIRRGVPHGGWCPKGRRAADGPLPARYNLRETESPMYFRRTKLNVRDSDATLIFNFGTPDRGTRHTIRFAELLGKPFLVVNVEEAGRVQAVQKVRAWLADGRFGALNVAGPREQKRPGAYAATSAVLDYCLSFDLSHRN